MISYLHTLRNDHQDKFSNHLSPHKTITKIIGHILNAVYYISVTYLYTAGGLYLLISFTCFVHPATHFLLITIQLFSVSLSLFCFVCLFCSIPHISEVLQYLSFSVRLVSHRIMPSRSIHVATNSKISLLWLRNILLCIYITSSLSIHLSMNTQIASISLLL